MISRVIYINTDFTHREERKRLETSKNVLNRKDEKQATTPAVFNSNCLQRGTHIHTHIDHSVISCDGTLIWQITQCT